MAPWYPCCCSGGNCVCDICSDVDCVDNDHATYSVQVTVTGFTCTGYPVDDCEPCQDGNGTWAASYAGSFTPTSPAAPGGDVAAYIGAETTPPAYSCNWWTEAETCSAPGVSNTVQVRVTLYTNDAGGVSIFVQVFKEESYSCSDPADGTQTAYYEGWQEIQASTLQIDCSTIDETVTCPLTYGDEGVFCSGPVDVRVEFSV